MFTGVVKRPDQFSLVGLYCWYDKQLLLIMSQFLRLFSVGLKQIGGFKHQIERSPVSDPHLLVSTQPVEYRQAGP